MVNTPDTMEAEVGCEKTHYHNKTWTLRCGKEDWLGEQAERANEVRVLSNWRILIQRARRSFLSKGRVLKPNCQHPNWTPNLNLFYPLLTLPMVSSSPTLPV